MSSFQFYSAKKLLNLIQDSKAMNICDIMLKAEEELTRNNRDRIFENMRYRLSIMKDAISSELSNEKKSKSKMIGGESEKMKEIKNENIFLSEIMRRACEYSLAVMEKNARMGRIVAAPTAGSSGILPGGIIATEECLHLSEDKSVEALFTAGAIGIIIAHNATFSAAEAGCQAEVGASSAMAAAALSSMRGMSPEQCINAAALALKNMLGLACDPIGGLVEVPCVKRNALGISHAMTASDMSLAGIKSVVPFDEVVLAMNNVAKSMGENIRETSRGGLAVSDTAKEIIERIREKRRK